MSPYSRNSLQKIFSLQKKISINIDSQLHPTVPVAGISPEDAWEKYQERYQKSMNEPEAFWTEVRSTGFNINWWTAITENTFIFILL